MIPSECVRSLYTIRRCVWCCTRAVVFVHVTMYRITHIDDHDKTVRIHGRTEEGCVMFLDMFKKPSGRHVHVGQLFMFFTTGVPDYRNNNDPFERLVGKSIEVYFDREDEEVHVYSNLPRTLSVGIRPDVSEAWGKTACRVGIKFI